MNDVDGWITIGTRLDTKKLDQQLKQQQRQLKQYEKENEKYTQLKTKYEQDLSAFEKEEKKYQDLTNQAEKYEKQIKKLQEERRKFTFIGEDGKTYINANDLPKAEELDKKIEEIRRKESNLDGEILKQGELIEKNADKYEKQSKELDDINLKLKANAQNQSLIKGEIEETTKNLNASKAMNYFNEQSKGINKVIKRIGSWALALIGIRGAYSAISRAMSTLSSFNKELKDDLSYIRISLASALEPIINSIIDGVYTILQYVQYLIYQWTGHNIFENANKNLKKANENARKLQKTMASFDEANTVSKKQEGITPTRDLSNVKSIDEFPKWIQTLDKYKDELAIIVGTIAGLFAINKISGWLSNLGLLFTGKNGLNSILSTLGEIALVAGSIKLIISISQKIKSEMKELSDQLQKMRENAEIVFKKWLDETDDVDELAGRQKQIVKNGTEATKQSKKLINNIVGAGKEYAKNAEQALNWNYDILKKEYEIWVQNGKTREEAEKLTKQFEGQGLFAEEIVRAMADQGMNISDARKKAKELNDMSYEIFKTWIFTKDETKKVENNTEGMVKNTKNTKNNIDDINNTDIKDKSFKITPELETNKMDLSLSSWINKLKPKIEEFFSKNGFISNLIKKMPGVKKTLDLFGIPYAKGGIAYNPIKLASGAIINRPSLGVPIGGERGMEGVVPLTDSQQMDLLGRAIGKYLNIRATIPVEFGNRQIARIVREIMAEDDFASNR